MDRRALLDRARAGDAEALAGLLQAFEPEIRRSVRALLGPLLRPYLDSLDVVQSVQVALLDRLRAGGFTLGEPEQLVFLATRMAQRKIADHWRKARRHRSALESLGRRDLAALLVSAAAVDDPAAAAASQEKVERVLDALGARERRAVELRLLGHSTAEAAEIMGLKANVLRAQLSELRRRLEEEGLLGDWI